MSRLTRHEILKEDKFLLTFETIRDFYLKHQRRILTGLGIAGLVAVLVAGGTYYAANQSLMAKDDLSQALKIYHAPVISSIRVENSATAGEPTYKIPNEKYGKALAEFQRIGSRYASGSVGKIAKYYAGLCLAGLSREKEAAAILEPLSREKSDYGSLARLALAQLYESTGEWAKAIETYRQIVDSNSPVTPKNVNMMHLGRLYEAQNRPGDATKLYQQMVKDFPGTPFASDAERKLKQASR